jgi:NitT/TauT family transport system permease protein
MILKVIKKLVNWIYGYLSIIIFLLIWQIVSNLGIVSQVFLPSFTTVFKELIRLIGTGELLGHIGISLFRSLTGFFLGLAFAIPLGLLIGWFEKFEKFIDPLIQTFRNLSVLSILPVFVLIFGIGEVSKIAVIFWGVLWSVIINTIAGVKNVDPLIIKGARSMGITNKDLFLKVIFPGALPSIFTGIRISATTSILVLIGAEMLGASKGLGYALYFYQANFKTPAMYAVIIIMAVLGVTINYILTSIEKKAFIWKEDVQK